MKIGYPCINYSVACKANTTFRLRNYSEENLIQKVTNNLDCLHQILTYNIKHEIYFFRISSSIIPFASHPICQFAWPKYFKETLTKLGQMIKQNNMRISMHPDQFTLINSPNKTIVDKSIKELHWHCVLLDTMKLDQSAKVQIHVGGLYGDKDQAIKAFIKNYKSLPHSIKKRLVIENDDRLFTVADCMRIYEAIGIPIIFDNLHHECNHQGETLLAAMKRAAKTWQENDGIPMTDYSSQEKNAVKGKHINAINKKLFYHYLQKTKSLDFDIMLEIKDKEQSALKAIEIAHQLKRIS